MANPLVRIPIVGKLFAGFGDNTPSQNTFMLDWSNPNAITKRTQLKSNVGYVWTCVGAIAGEVGKIQFKIVKDNSRGDEVEIDNHPFITLLRKPNPFISQFVLFELTQAFIELTGEAFWYFRVGEVSRKPKEIYLLRPDLVQVIMAKNGYITGYVYNLPSGEQVPLELDEVMHFKLPNPEDPSRGYGVVAAGQLYIQTEEYASRFTRNFLFNNARPSGILSVPQMNEDDFKQLKERWRSEYGSVDNAGKVAIVRNSEVTFTQLGTGLEGIALETAKHMSRDDIMAMFRVPKPILGITEDVNRANAESSEYIFAKRVIDPKMYRIADTLETYIDKTYGDPSITVRYESPVPEDRTSQLSEDTAAINMWKTRDEIRAEKGLGPTEGGDQFYLPFNLSPAGSPIAAKILTDVKKENSKATIKIIHHKKPKIKTLIISPETKENFRVSLIKMQEKYAKVTKKQVAKFLKKQEKIVIDRLTPQFVRSKAYNDILFDLDEETKRLIEEVYPILVELAKDQGPIALQLAGEDKLKFEITQRITDNLKDRLARAGLNFNRETRVELEKILTDATLNNATLRDTTKKIEGFYSSSEKFRAERIARTETLDASTEATLEAYRQTGFVVKKEWFANPGACQFCQAMHGTVLGLETTYLEPGQSISGTEGGIYNIDYDSVEGPPLHPNCTCTVIPVVE